MPLQAGTGTTLHVSASTPASESQSAYGALTYSKVASIESIGAGGVTRGEITFVDLETGGEEVFAGTKSYQARTVALGEVESDAGQGIIETAVGDGSKIAVKITLPDGAIRYFTARILSFTDAEHSTNSVIRKEASLRQVTDAIRVDAP